MSKSASLKGNSALQLAASSFASLQADLHVEDPGAFTMPRDAVQRWDRVNPGWLSEFICPEDNLNFGNIDPMPEAKKADF